MFFANKVPFFSYRSDECSGAKSFIVMMPTNSVYCHKSHSHFALLIAQKIFAIILRLPFISFVSFARLSA